MSDVERHATDGDIDMTYGAKVPSRRAQRAKIIGSVLVVAFLVALGAASFMNSEMIAPQPGAALDAKLEHPVLTDAADPDQDDAASWQDERAPELPKLRVATPRIHLSELWLTWKSMKTERGLAAEIARKMSKSVDTVRAPTRSERLALLERGDADMAIGRIPLTEEVREKFDTSIPLAYMSRVLVMRAGAPVLKPQDLKGRHLLIKADDPALLALRELQKEVDDLKVEVVSATTSQWILALRVVRESADGMLAWEDQAEEALAHHPGLKASIPVGEPIPVGWVMRKGESKALRLNVNTLFAHTILLDDLDGALYGDLETVRERGILRVLMRHGPTSFFVHRGQQMGRDYELAQALAAEMGLQLRVVTPPPRMRLVTALENGLGDMIIGMSASNKAIDKKKVAATSTYARADKEELDFRTSQDAAKAMNSEGPISLVFATRIHDVKLLEAAHAFVDQQLASGNVRAITSKYHEDFFEEVTQVGHALSEFDDIIKKVTESTDFDWRLIAAQVFQESSFDPRATSWAGAKGLMQLMPRTARWLDVSGSLYDPETSVEGGVKYMEWLKTMYEKEGLPMDESLRFALASYNAGQGHVADGRELAKELGLDPNQWYGNVEQAIALLSEKEYASKARYGYCRCEEAVNYVRRIEARYADYATHLEAASRASSP